MILPLIMYPETKHGGDRKSDDFKRKPFSLDSFSQDTSKKLGFTPQTINQEIQIARDIMPEVQEFIKEKEIPDK